jgi:hypothetical protein
MFDNLPTLWFGVLSIGSFVIVAIIGLLVTRQIVYRFLGSPFINNESIEPFYSGALVFYGIMLGLITVATWEHFTEVEDIVSAESVSLAVLYRDVSGYPEPIRTELQNHIRDYTRFIIDEVWPAQARGVILTEGVTRMNAFQEALLAFEPVTEGQKILHAEAFKAYNEMIEQRRLRIETITGNIPATMWVVVVIGGFVIIGLAYTFRVDDLKLHAFLVGTIAILIGMLVFVIYTLESPYRGDVSIQPDSYQLVLDTLMQLPATDVIVP